VTAQITDTNAVTELPFGNALTDGVDDADDLVSGHHRLTRVGAHALYREHVAVAHAAAVHPEPYVTRPWLERLALDQFELPLSSDLVSAKCRHVKPPSVALLAARRLRLP
jgi:hypothetical protein